MIFRFLSPVHIGSGQELQKGIDYDTKDNSVFFIDQDKLFNALIEKNELGLVENFFEACLTTNFFNLTNSLGLNPNDFVYMNRSYNGQMRESIKEFARDGNGNYYIPGSSIKGAIKSIYFEKLLQGWTEKKLMNNIVPPLPDPPKNARIDRTKAASNLIKVFATHSPAANYDLFRALQFNDFYIEESKIGIIENIVLSLQKDNTLVVKEDKKSYAQAVYPGREILIDKLFKLDTLLFKAGKMQKTLKFEAGLLIEDEFRKIVNEYAKKTIKSEIEFFNKYPNKNYKDQIIKFYEGLLEKLENNKNIIIFRMSAGSGWKFMTGNITLKDDRANLHSSIKKTFNLGKKDCNIFPKTRRLAICADGAVYPLGWVEIDYSADKLNLNKEAEEATLVVKPKKVSEETYIQKNSTRKYKQGDKLEAIVTAFNKPNINVKLLDNRYKEQFSIKYSVGLDVGTIIEVEIKQISKDKIIFVAFSKKL